MIRKSKYSAQPEAALTRKDMRAMGTSIEESLQLIRRGCEEIIEEEEEAVHVEGDDEEVSYETDEVETYECPECGAAITVDMSSCPKCGVGLSFEIEESDEEEEEEED